MASSTSATTRWRNWVSGSAEHKIATIRDELRTLQGDFDPFALSDSVRMPKVVVEQGWEPTHVIAHVTTWYVNTARGVGDLKTTVKLNSDGTLGEATSEKTSDLAAVGGLVSPITELYSALNSGKETGALRLPLPDDELPRVSVRLAYLEAAAHIRCSVTVRIDTGTARKTRPITVPDPCKLGIMKVTWPELQGVDSARHQPKKDAKTLKTPAREEDATDEG